ncbi:MAG: c-type cytochrome [Crocinitomicaceae bacterium]|nr:c-type cytochrome [Flavobacteriales bacterium]NQZ35785.1 c-type cytochrome [Crocinitomicaceae bacterium]
MKISISQMFRNLSKWCLNAVAATLLLGTLSVNAQDQPTEAAIDGGGLFSSQCATCHNPHKDGTGPKLSGVRSSWEEATGSGDAIIDWVQNWESAVAKYPYAAGVAQKKTTKMNKFPNVSKAEVSAILDWVDAQVEPGPTVAGGSGGAAGSEEEGGFPWIWVILGVLFIVIIAAVSGVRRQLKIAAGEETSDDSLSYGEEFKKWSWKNLRFVLIGSVVIFISLIVVALQGLGRIGVVENYQPSQPIDFPHSVHAGDQGIDCKYCHNSVTKSRTAGLPTVNVCMNCHKQVAGNDDEQKAKISKIYAAAGWDGEGYTGKTNPIVWNKVHVLPDHVYFNHSQHVVVGGVDCKQCHGDMTKMESTAKVQPISELNKVEGNIVLTRPTLTMGWCIECHAEKEISTGSIDTKGGGYYEEIHRRLLNHDEELYNKYLEDGKVTVKELGGWECSKCHY